MRNCVTPVWGSEPRNLSDHRVTKALMHHSPNVVVVGGSKERIRLNAGPSEEIQNEFSCRRTSQRNEEFIAHPLERHLIAAFEPATRRQDRMGSRK